MFRLWRPRSKPSVPVGAESPPGAAAQPPVSGGSPGAGPAGAGAVEGEPPDTGRPPGRARRHSAEERDRLLAEFAASELTAEQFAAQHGLRASTLATWKKRQGKARAAQPKQRRFTPEERRGAVEAFLKSGRKREDFAKLWGCSPSSLDKWLRRYKAEGPKGLEDRPHPSGRREPSPRRLPDAARAQIVAVRAEHPAFGAQRVADHLARFGGLEVSPSTVRNVLREAGVPAQATPPKKRRRGPKPPRRFERAKPGELWQSDITSYVLRRQGRRVYFTVFLDDHSRFVVAWALATHQRTPLVTEPLLEGIARFGKPEEVLTDQGRQYYAWRGKSGFQKLLAKEGIAHVVSRAHHPETLGKCERLWKTVADEFWDRANPEDLDDARRRIAHWIRHYNFFRPHQGIDGLVPADRFFGAESALREALERELEANELRLALDQAPRTPVYLAGQIGEQRIALHGERGRLVIETPDGGRRELDMQELGVTNKEQDDGSASARNELESGDGAETPQADGPQAHELQEGPAPGLAGEGAVGSGLTGGEAAVPHGVHGDPRVLAGQEDQGPGGGGAVGDAAAGVAALAAGAVGDDGGPSDPAAAAGEPRRAPASQRRDPGLAAEARQGAREAARAHGGPGAGAAHGPVVQPSLGVGPERRVACEQEAHREDARPPGAEDGSEPCSETDRTRRRLWPRWLRPKA